MTDEIIIHEKQTTISDFITEPKFSKCRWSVEDKNFDYVCTCPSSDFRNEVVNVEDDIKCECCVQFFGRDFEDNFVDQDTGSLL